MLIERAGLTPPAPRLVVVIPVSEGEEGAALALLQRLRAQGVAAEMGYRGNLKRRMERANKQGARAAFIIGESEAARGVAQFRDLDAGTQEEVAWAEAAARVTRA